MFPGFLFLDFFASDRSGPVMKFFCVEDQLSQQAGRAFAQFRGQSGKLMPWPAPKATRYLMAGSPYLMAGSPLQKELAPTDKSPAYVYRRKN
jgi:hypothetical protein